MIILNGDNETPETNVSTNFGDAKTVVTKRRGKNTDYTKQAQEAEDVKRNPVDETEKDVQALNNPMTRTREASRRAETADPADTNKGRFPEIDMSNVPPELDDPVIVPDDKKHGAKLKTQFGSGPYEMTRRSLYEGEIS